MSCRASFHARVLSYLAIPECKPRRGSAGGAVCYDYDMRPFTHSESSSSRRTLLFAQGDGSSSAPPADSARVSRRVGRDRGEHRLAVQARAVHVGSAARAPRDPRSGASSLKINAVVFQVRPGADALYASPYEPWSQFLTGRQGRAPEPPWDPLAFAVEQAHKRGLELHAWFNPYRAAYKRDTLDRAHAHQHRPIRGSCARTGAFLWMDPGDPEVRRRSLRAIVDVVKRYDVDGVHIDDYFYPYPENDPRESRSIFPTRPPTRAIVKDGGKLAKDDWRRDNVDKLVEAFYKGVHAAKPWVKVGISPFGIWRPGNPPQIKGFDAYAEIYADSKKWLQNGWVDYLAPQLYWPIAPPDQSFPVLYDWWLSA